VAQQKFGSAGVTSREIDTSGPVTREPTGIPAGVIGTAKKGPAFVPVTVGNTGDFFAKFGETDGKKFGPLAVVEWLRNAGSVTYLRVLGVGDGKQRVTSGGTAGAVTGAGFTVGEELPGSTGAIVANPYANAGGVPGRTYFLGAFMSESAGSTVFSSANLQGPGSVTPGITGSLPIIRGVLMAPSGVIISLSSSLAGNNNAPASTTVASIANARGGTFGAVDLMAGTVAKSEFVVLLNGHKGTDPLYPNVITASFDMTAPNYFANVFNKDATKIQQAGHFLYSNWDIHPSTAVVTGSGVVHVASGASAATAPKSGSEIIAFCATSSLARDNGSTTVPNFEAWTDRFTNAKSPWIISQKFGGVASDLFRFHAIDAGAGVSTNYKISIENIAPSTDTSNLYGTFDVVIRDWSDRDGALLPLEQFRGLSLNPSDDRYISKVIGDANAFFDFDRSESAQKIVLEGNYPLQSNLVRVEVNTSIENDAVDATALPFGFRGAEHLVTSGTAVFSTTDTLNNGHVGNYYLRRAITPPVPFRSNITVGSGLKTQVNPLLYWGVQFEHVASLSTPNASTLKNASLEAFAKYYPNFSTVNQNVVVGDNAGTPDTAANGIIDADRFCLNAFTLENVQVVTNSAGLADPSSWGSAVYVRDGNITSNSSAKTRRVSASDFNQSNRRYLKFSFFMQGGFDGVNLFNTDETEINNAAVTADMDWSSRGRDQGNNVRTYVKALDVMKNTTNVDIQLLAIPGIRHPIVTDAAAEAVKERFDALYLMDVEQLDNDSADVTSDSQKPSVSLTSQQFSDRAIDNSFAAAYFPDVLMTDPTTRSNLYVPPSVVVLGALALNDAVGHPWFAPAGTTRGALPTTLEARVKLSKENMDTLYDVNINPLVAFPGSSISGTGPKGGVIVWGQKTLQAAASALDRVNVRRLLIDIRRQVRDISRTIIFEPNREATLARFSAAVTPRLQRIQAQAGLESFNVIIDSSTTTQSDIENNTIRGKIFVVPTKSIEYVSLDFEVTNNIQQG
jgi:phage tail sheath protein FI